MRTDFETAMGELTETAAGAAALVLLSGSYPAPTEEQARQLAAGLRERLEELAASGATVGEAREQICRFAIALVPKVLGRSPYSKGLN